MTWCAASLFKMLYDDTKFLPKLRKCCHEVMVDNCYKSLVAVEVGAREVVIFFWRSAPFQVTSPDF